MISGYHDLHDRPRFARGPVFAFPVAVGSASGAQVIVSYICQFGALEDPEDRPPSVLSTMLSGIRPVRVVLSGVVLSGVVLLPGAVLSGAGLSKAGCRSSGWPGEGPAAEEVPVDVRDGLARVDAGGRGDFAGHDGAEQAFSHTKILGLPGTLTDHPSAWPVA
jgi:hypothetical protein